MINQLRERRYISSLVELLILCCIIVTIVKPYQVSSFHLSFGQRLIKSANNPQLNPASTLIRPVECKNANNHSEVGICMFSIDCMQNKGVPLSVCKHNYFVGTCCRLPDYNNFVGIVYDLRDTDANQVLEMRRISPDTRRSELENTTTAPIPIITELAAANIVTTLITSSPFSTNQSVAQSSQTRFLVGQELPIITSTVGPMKVKPAKDEERLEEKYVISSTSLFPPTLQPIFQTERPGQHEPQPPTEIQPMRLGLGSNRETARNADGIAPSFISINNLPINKHQIVVPSELNSFQIQTTLSNKTLPMQIGQRPQESTFTSGSVEVSRVVPIISQPQPQQQQNVYELIKDDSLEVISTITSAHLAPTTQQQFNLMEHSSMKDSELKRSTDVQPDKSAPQQQNSIYLIDDNLQQNNSQMLQNVVFANNHQSQSGSTHRSSNNITQFDAPPAANFTSSISTTNNNQQLTSDQEFTLSSVASMFGSEESYKVTNQLLEQLSTKSSVGVSSNNGLAINNANQSITLAFPSQSVTLSPFNDLVSSSQTTTPFTTSLSTALLPNVSAHRYSPTTPASVPISSLVPNQILNSTSTTTRLPLSSFAQKPTSESPSFGFSQLYSNQHSNSNSQHEDSHLAGSLYNNRSNLILGYSPTLQAASKIVTGGSSASNLVPGLSSLQSAILSHIPFKIASGLSSGLTSYLQAAMKPTGSRPLLSSNTAPSLQFQQQQIQQQANLTKQTSVASSSLQASTVRFPGLQSQSSAAPVADGTSFNDLTSSSQPSSVLNWQQHNLASQTSAPVVRDMVKEAQQVCGRPQVNSQATSSNEGKKRIARIVGGNQSLFGQWPWMVSLRQWRKGAFLHKCGAALLNENWAITAAHCVENVKASDLLLRLGEFDVSNQEEPYPFIERRVKTVVSHPSFDPKTFEYDLALLRFAEPVKYERNIVPVCVPPGNDTYVDRMATVIGWGRLYEDGPLPDVIQHVDVPIITNNECEKMYKNAGYIEEIPEMFICAGISKGGRDSCEGDSGGPLTMVDHDGRSYLVGIISWGIGCALPSQPGVYTRITAFSGWINKITAF